MEFSKRIFIFVSVGASIVSVFAMVMMWKTNDLSPMMYLIPAMFTELATATGFYYNKAKAENKIKISKSQKISFDEVNKLDGGM